MNTYIFIQVHAFVLKYIPRPSSSFKNVGCVEFAGFQGENPLSCFAAAIFLKHVKIAVEILMIFWSWNASSDLLHKFA